MELTRTLYDFSKMAKDYDKWYETAEGKMHDQQQKELVLKCLSQVSPGERLLDIGCGTGHWSGIFSSLGFEVKGIDISPEMIEVAQSHHYPGCRFEIADVCHLPYANNLFEVVAGVTALEFIPDVKAAIAEMFRCVKPKGKVVIGTLDKEASLNKQRIFQKEEPYISARLFSGQEFSELLLPYGKVNIHLSGQQQEGKIYRKPTFWQEREEYLWGRQDNALIVAEVQL